MNANGHSRRGGEPARQIDAPFAVPFMHRIRFTTGVFDAANSALREVLTQRAEKTGPVRMIVFVDQGVAMNWPALSDDVRSWADINRDVVTLTATPAIVPGGERAKNDWSVFETVAAAIHDHRICRHSFVLAIGGGAMLDAVGFAAATAHRGVRLIRFPTTTLAQCDAAIGVKNGINAFGKKNFLGTFSPPWAVLNDSQFLSTLDDRDWRAGLSEIVKVAVLKDPAFFEQAAQSSRALAHRDTAAALPLIQRSAELHLRHITEGGDPFETRTARPLDFGHWSAHKLEQMTEYEVRHGEAVAIGIALDVLYSLLIGAIPYAEADRILSVLSELGFALYHPALDDHQTLLGGLDEFREHLGGRLTITLLSGIGCPINVHDIDREKMVEAIGNLSERSRQFALLR